MISVNLSDITILNIKGSDYHCIISLISKKEAINFLQNANLTEKKWNKKYINFLKVYITWKKAVTKFCDIEIEKQKFRQHKGPILIKM